MTPQKIAKMYGPRIMAFLNHLAAELRKSKIAVDDPQYEFDVPNDQYIWVMLVHPWEKTVDAPDDALDVIFRLIQQPEEDLIWVNFFLDLIVVAGREIDSIDMGDPVKSTNKSGLEEQLREFEMGGTVLDIAKRIQAYISSVRRKRPEGPREWSPRWDKHSMGAGGLGVKHTYELGPLTAEVEALGKVRTAWYSMENHYNVRVTDRHGHEFKAGWYSHTDQPEKIAWNIAALLFMAYGDEDYENFVDYFSGGYRGEERRWRVEEGRKLQVAARTFDSAELAKAAAKTSRQITYFEDRGPRDWSPRREMPLE